MGDDNEIRSLIRRESETFLKKALNETKEVAKPYDFQYEFAKTKKNRSFLVVGATLATILALAGAAFGVARIVQRQTAATPVDVRAFEDLNLKDLLDSAKRNETDMDMAKQSLLKLDYDLRNANDGADREYAAAVDSIKARGLSPADEASQIAAAGAARDAKKAQIKADYDAAAGKLKKQIADIQAKMDKYDQRLMDQANKQQAILDNQRRAFEIEKKQQADAYEARIADLDRQRKADIADLTRQRDELAASLTARYNPNYADDRTSALLKGFTAPKSYPNPAVLPAYLEKGGFLDAGSSDKLDRSLADFRYLSAKIRAIPFINSVPPALARMEAEAVNSILSYRTALSKATGGLLSRDQQIADLQVRAKTAEDSLDRYNWAVSEYVQENREGGYILDPRNAANVTVALNPAVPVSDGAKGYIIRGEKAIGTLSFTVVDGKATAKIVDVANGETVMPFDTILVHADSGASQ